MESGENGVTHVTSIVQPTFSFYMFPVMWAVERNIIELCIIKNLEHWTVTVTNDWPKVVAGVYCFAVKSIKNADYLVNIGNGSKLPRWFTEKCSKCRKLKRRKPEKSKKVFKRWKNFLSSIFILSQKYKSIC